MSGSKHKKHRHQKFRSIARRRGTPGAAPGTVTIEPGAQRPKMSIIAYSPDKLEERAIENAGELTAYLGHWPVVWLDVDGLGDAATIRQIGEIFHLHPLALEDTVNVHQRAKVDAYGDHLFIVARMIPPETRWRPEQLSIFVGRNFVITFQERPGDCLDPVRERLRRGYGRGRFAGPDYLAYAILDAVVDSYFPVVEQYGETLDQLDADVAAGEIQDTMERIHEIRSEMLLVRRAFRPHREALNELIRDSTPLISHETQLYLRDCYDHSVQLIDLLDVYREMCSDLRDYYLSSVSNRLNVVMKVLTVIATIFMPLNFIAAVWGMNFKHMPELEWRWGYPLALSFMTLVGLAMLIAFYHLGWMGTATGPRHPHASRNGGDGPAAGPPEHVG